jgi:hypothetical protein
MYTKPLYYYLLEYASMDRTAGAVTRVERKEFSIAVVSLARVRLLAQRGTDSEGK